MLRGEGVMRRRGWGEKGFGGEGDGMRRNWNEKGLEKKGFIYVIY